MTPDQNPATIESLLAQARWLDALARRLVSDPHEADDIVQETWIAALKHPPHASVPMRSWLARVARNFAIQRGRGESARKKREQSVAREEPSMGDSAAIDRAQTHRRLVDAVLALDEPYRSTVVLHYFDHLSIAQIAVRQSTPESTVRTRLSRATSTLRARFEREDGDAWSAAFLPLFIESHHVPLTPATTAASLTTTTVIGGIAMATAWKIGASVAAAALVGWLLWQSRMNVIEPALEARHRVDEAKDALALPERGEQAPRVALSSATETSDSNGEPNTDADARGSLDVHVMWGDDRSPAAGVAISLWQGGSPDPFTNWRDARTNADGAAHFDELFTGVLLIEVDRGGQAHVDLVAGKPATAEITIPDAVDVDGTVVDENGTPVADARIWVSHYFNFTNGNEIERSDARGRYHVRDVGDARYVAALHEGYGPSELHLLEPHPAGSRVELPLVVTRSTTRITGSVRDENGRPLPGAAVVLTPSSRSTSDGSGRWTQLMFPPVHLVTDSIGEFAAREMGDGQVNVIARAGGFAPGGTSVPSTTSPREPIEVRLHRQAVLHGFVRHADGTPAANVLVARGRYGDAMSNQTWTRHDGSYRLEQLPAGSIEVRFEGREDGDERHTFELAPGGDVEWNVTLHPNAGVMGRVVDEQGKALSGWLVAAVNVRELRTWKISTHTDADGKFTLGNWPEDANALAVREPDSLLGEPAALVADAKPGTSDVLVTVKADGLRSAHILGRVLDAAGRPMPETQLLWMSSKTHQGKLVPTDAAGRFRIGPLRSGDYELRVDVSGQASKVVHDVHLAPKQELDVGDVRLERSGTLEVHVHLPPGISADTFMPSLTLRRIGTKNEAESMTLKNGQAHLGGLLAGEYVVSSETESLRVRARATIAVDQTTSIDVTAEPATSRSVQFGLPVGTPTSTLVRMRLLDSSGEDVYGGEMEIPISTPVWLGGLVMGTYSLEARIGEGSITHLPLDITSLEPSMDVIELHLR